MLMFVNPASDHMLRLVLHAKSLVCLEIWHFSTLAQYKILFFAFYTFPASVIYYNLRVPEGERHDSAVKRNKEALTAELKLWEGYLQVCE